MATRCGLYKRLILYLVAILVQRVPNHAGETVVSASLLTIGNHHPLHIREERISARVDACRVTYISDIHLRHGRSDQLVAQVLDSVIRCESHAVLLGGDLVDSPSELNHLTDLVGKLCEIAPVMAVAGNHDNHVGTFKVRDAVRNGGGQWIHDRAVRMSHGARTIVVSGPDAALQTDGDVRILCAHNPRVWKRSQHDGYDLVLAGHLHGCQFVAFEYRDRLFPGAMFYPFCFLSHQSGATRLVVSRGVSDLVPIRWRCPREVVLCHV